MRALTALALSLLVLQAAAAGKPNLLFLMADQLRWDSLGYAQQLFGTVVNGTNSLGHISTPNIDQLASESLIMRYSYASTPTCTPARAAILTGQSTWNHGMLGYGNIAERYPVEMPQILANAGYHTVALGKDHFGWNTTSNTGFSHGYQDTSLYDGLGQWDPNSTNLWDGEYDDYDQWFQSMLPGKDPQATMDWADGDGWNSWLAAPYIYDEHLHPTGWLGRKAVDFIVNQSQALSPWFLKVSFHRPHSPYDPPQRLLDKVAVSDLPQIIQGGNWDTFFRGGPGDPPGCGPSDNDAWCGLMPKNTSDLSRRAYYASIMFVDEQIGAILDALNQTGQTENTFILWTADHGDGQGDHYHWRKGYPYEFSSHVPMLLRWPDSYPGSVAVKRGTVISSLVSELRDIFHTMVDAAGAASLVPSGHFTPDDGKSLLCLLSDPTGHVCAYRLNPGPWRKYVDMEHSVVYNNTVHWNALTDGRIKYIFNAFFPSEQLFNLTADPQELTDLSGDPKHASLLDYWRHRLVLQFQKENRGPDWVKNGTLQQRINGQTYGPNFPQGPIPEAGDGLTPMPNGSPNDCWVLEGSLTKGQNMTRLHLLASDGGPLSPYCLATKDNSNLAIDTCDAAAPFSPAQHFYILNHTSSALPPSNGGQALIHVPSGLCVILPGTSAASPIVLADCATATPANSLWVFGQSGRLCIASVDLCITVDAQWEQTDPMLDRKKY